MLGIPTTTSIADNNGFDISNNYVGAFIQDSWRATPNLTLNFGLRFEHENGIKEKDDRMALWFDPNAEVSIAAAAEAAYARNPIPQVPPSQFNVQGGIIYAGTPGYDRRIVETRVAVDAAFFVWLQTRRAERHQRWLRRLLRHDQRAGLVT